MRRMRGDLAADQVAHHDPARLAIDDDHIEHLVPVVHRHGAKSDLPLECLVGADQQLLASLSPGVECPRNLGTTEGAVGQHATVVTSERHSLRDALVDDAPRDLGKAIDVRLTGPEIAALDGVLEEPLDGVAVIRVVLGGVDAALRGDGVGPSRRVLEAEAGHLVAELGQRGRRRGARQSRADHDDVELPLVRR